MMLSASSRYLSRAEGVNGVEPCQPQVTLREFSGVPLRMSHALLIKYLLEYEKATAT